MKKIGVTLFELLIAITLLSAIILGLSNIEIFSRTHLISSDRRAQLQNEASYILEHMTKYLLRAVGNPNEQPIGGYSDNRGFRIRIDDNPANGRVDTGDTWVAYRHIGNTINFYSNAGTNDLPLGPAGTPEVIANHVCVTVNPFDADTSSWGLVLETPGVNQFDITIRSRWDTSQPQSQGNPQIDLDTSVVAPSVSAN